MENRNGVWYSADGKWRWDGEKWQPATRMQAAKGRLWIVAVVVSSIVIVGLIAYAALSGFVEWGNHNPSTIKNVKFTDQYVQFDYTPTKDCTHERFDFEFDDKYGSIIGMVVYERETTVTSVRAGETYHVSWKADDSVHYSIPAGTNSVIITPWCRSRSG